MFRSALPLGKALGLGIAMFVLSLVMGWLVMAEPTLQTSCPQLTPTPNPICAGKPAPVCGYQPYRPDMWTMFP